MNGTITLSEKLVRRASCALGAEEAKYQYVGDTFRDYVCELFERGHYSPLVDMVDAFCRGLKPVSAAESERRMLWVIDEVSSSRGMDDDSHLREDMRRFLLSEIHAFAWFHVPTCALTHLLEPRTNLGDLPLVKWETELQLATDAITASDWGTRDKLAGIRCVGTYHPENRFTTETPIVIDMVSKRAHVSNGMHRLVAASACGATHVVARVVSRYGATVPGVRLSPTVPVLR